MSAEILHEGRAKQEYFIKSAKMLLMFVMIALTRLYAIMHASAFRLHWSGYK